MQAADHALFREPAEAAKIEPAPSVEHSLQEAVSYHAQGRFREAEQLYRLFLQSDASDVQVLHQLGSLCAQQGRFAEAQDWAERAITLNPDLAEAHQLVAVALTGLNCHEQALPYYEKALAINPKYAEAHNNLGYSLQWLGRSDESIVHFQQALAILPTYPEAHNNLGNSFLALKQLEKAASHFRQALALRSPYAEAHHNLANCLALMNRPDQALTEYQKANTIKTDYAESYYKHGRTLERARKNDEAIAQFRKVLSINPRHIEARNSLGRALHGLGRSEEALAHFDKVSAISPRHVPAHMGRGDALFALGEIDEARRAFEAALTLAPGTPGCYLGLAHCKRFTATDRHFVAMNELAGRMQSLATADQIQLHFALGKAFADVGDSKKSFSHFLQGNALKRREVQYDEAKTLGLLERIQKVFTKSLMEEKSGQGNPSSVPIFIVGMPRSGSTLVEQIIASHPKVFGAGELRELGRLTKKAAGPNGDFPESISEMSREDLVRLGTDYLSAVTRLAPDAARITDKMLDNFAIAGLIHLALPETRIIHTWRDPGDTAISCFSTLFGDAIDYSYNLAELGRYYRAYRRSVAHWWDVLPAGVMLDVRYEDVVADVEGQARRILAFCGLEWDEACLAFHKTKRPVLTASAAQVRRPIYESSVGKWRAYEEQLRPFMQSLNGNGEPTDANAMSARGSESIPADHFARE